MCSPDGQVGVLWMWRLHDWFFQESNRPVMMYKSMQLYGVWAILYINLDLPYPR